MDCNHFIRHIIRHDLCKVVAIAQYVGNITFLSLLWVRCTEDHMRVRKDRNVYSSHIMFLILPSGKARMKKWRKGTQSNEKTNTVSIFHTANLFHTVTIKNVKSWDKCVTDGHYIKQTCLHVAVLVFMFCNVLTWLRHERNAMRETMKWKRKRLKQHWVIQNVINK